MSVITTDLNYGAVVVAGAVKTTGTTPNPGQLAIDDTKAKISRFGDKALITLPVAFDDNDLITITFGTSNIPAGAEILTPLDSNSDGVDVKIVSNNSFSIQRVDTGITGVTHVAVMLYVDGFDDISIERSSNLPFELDNERMDPNFFASDVVLDAEFRGLQRNDDRTLISFHFSSILLTGTQFTCNLIRTKNGSTTHKTVVKPIGDITVVDGEFTVEFTGAEVSDLGLTNVTMRVSETYALLGGSGFTEAQTKFDSNYIFASETDVDFKKAIVGIPTEIMGGLEDVNGFNFKEAFKEFELTSKFNEVPEDNYVRLNYFTASITGNTIYMSFRIYTKDDVLIREISGGGNMTVAVTNWKDIYQDYELDGWRVRWRADFSFLQSNTTISGLTKENAAFKIPAKNLDRSVNYYDEKYTTLSNTVNKRNFDISRFVENIRIIPNNKEFVMSNGAIKSARTRYINVSPTQYYIAFEIGGTQYTGVTVPRNANTGIFDVEFIYPDFKAVVSADWNSITDYNFNYDTVGANSSTLKQQVLMNGYLEALMNENATGLTENDKYAFMSSAARMLPYLFKSVDWSQSSKEVKTCWISLTDNNDEPEALTKVLEFVNSDDTIKKAIKFAIGQGDFATTATITSAQDFADRIDAMFNAITTDLPILYCKGNHCLGLDGITDFSLAPSHATIKTLLVDRFYNRLPQNYKDATTFGTAQDAAYYYCDVPDTNVRVIALDQFEYPIVEGTGRAMKYSGAAIFQPGTSNIIAGFNVYHTEAQLNFLIDALNTMADNQTAVILTHIPINSNADNNGELNALGNSNIALRAILKSFKDKTSVAVNVDAIDEIAAFTVNTTFSGRTESRIVVTEGHLHNSYYYELEDTGIMSLRNRAIGNTSPYIGIDGKTVAKYGADVMCLDEDKRELIIARYGTVNTIRERQDKIGVGEHGFNFTDEPLKI